jgi:hypothetical protein
MLDGTIGSVFAMTTACSYMSFIVWLLKWRASIDFRSKNQFFYSLINWNMLRPRKKSCNTNIGTILLFMHNMLDIIPTCFRLIIWHLQWPDTKISLKHITIKRVTISAEISIVQNFSLRLIWYMQI